MTEKAPQSAEVAKEPIDKDLALECIAYLQKQIKALEKLKIRIEKIFSQSPELLNAKTLAEILKFSEDEKFERYSHLLDLISHDQTFSSVKNEFYKYNSILEITPWKNEEYLSHNIGNIAYQSFSDAVGDFFVGDLPGGDDDFSNKKILRCFNNIGALLEQTIAHLQSIKSIIQEKIGSKESIPASCKVIEAMRVSLKSRILFNPKLQFVNEEPAPDQNAIQVSISAQDPDIEVPVDLHDLIEKLYNPNSNAGKITAQELKNGANPEDLVIENNVFEITYRGKKYVAIEVFNSGRLLDLTKIQQKMLELEDYQAEKLHPRVQVIVDAIKKGSRQASLNQIDPVTTLFLDGFTTGTGGTGIGLNTMYEHLEMRNGAVMIDNVFGKIPKETGVCITIIFPQEIQSGKGIDTSKMKANLHKLKELMQTGQYFLPREKLKKVAA